MPLCLFIETVNSYYESGDKNIDPLLVLLCLRMLQDARDVHRMYVSVNKKAGNKTVGETITADIPMTIMTFLQKQNFFSAHWSCHAVCQVNR